MASFYAKIISEFEKEISSIELKKVAKDLSAYYSSSNKDMKSHPDYNNPAYCCAYIYKYAPIHTRIATKYFRKMSTKKEIKDILLRKNEIKICCLGGGPGIEIVGICKALAFSPSLHNKVRKVSVLDKFHGWEPFFNSIMLTLADGKDEILPETFLGKSLKKEFVQVDFQYSLSQKANQVISQADIVCMIKHNYEFSIEEYSCISQVLGKLFKKNALILYIDKAEKISLEAVDYISKSSNFKVVMGPLEGEKFENKFVKSNVETYGCYPHTFSKVSVIGWIKTSTASDAYFNESFSVSHSSLTDIGSIGTESETMDTNILQSEAMDSDVESEIVQSDTGSEIMYSDIGSEDMHCDTKRKTVNSSKNRNDSKINCELNDCDMINLDEKRNNISCNKYTQTENDLFQSDTLKSETEVELAALVEALADLVTVIEKFALNEKVINR